MAPLMDFLFREPYTPARVARLLTAPSLRRAVEGKVVLVTGASSGIGRATALAVGRAGAQALLVARTEVALDEVVEEIRASGGTATALACDLSDADAVAALGERVVADFGGVDVLVNNAGKSIRRAVGDEQTKPHDFRRTMQLNYFGALDLTLALVPGMRARRDGHVINISSLGVQIGTPRFAAYLASKAAMDAFSRSLAAEVRGDGVAITTIHLPLVRTPMIDGGAYSDAPALSTDEAAGIVLEAIRTRPIRSTPRLGTMIELGDVVAPRAVGDVMGLAHRLSAGEARTQADHTIRKVGRALGVRV